MENVCPWCSAPRGAGTDCPECGANYAKAEAIKLRGRAEPAAPARAAAAEPVYPAYSAVADPALELKVCLFAIPSAMLLAALVNATAAGKTLQRIAFGMPLHELGHSFAAWLSGFDSLPTLWFALTPEERGWLCPLALAAALGYAAWQCWVREALLPAAAFAALLAAQAFCTFALDVRTARSFIVFSGDGGCLVLGTALMASFFFGKETQLYKGWLRWGFVFIGAMAFADVFSVWWAARLDQYVIPLGTVNGTATDAVKLIGEHRWTIKTLVFRYLALGFACLLSLVSIYAWGVLDARREVLQRAAR